MLDPTLDRDREIALSDRRRAPDDGHAMCAADLPDNRRWRREHRPPGGAERGEERRILKFPRHLRMEVLVFEPLLERPAQRGIAGRQHRRRSAQRLRKAAP